MRVLQVHCGYRTPAGEDSVVASEADLLVQAGHEVTSFVETNPTSVPAAVLGQLRSLNNRSVTRRLNALLESQAFDVAHVHNTWYAMSQAVLAQLKRHGIPVVMTVHNYRMACIRSDLFRGGELCTACVGQSALPGVLNRCYRNSAVLSSIAALEITYHKRRNTLVDNVDLFIVPTAFVGDRLADFGMPPDRIRVKPHFVFDPGVRSNPASASTDLLYVGRLAEGKGIDALLRAWEVLGSRSRLQLTILGQGPISQHLRESAPRGVNFVGWESRQDVLARMLGSRALIFPSEWFEPFGMVIVEALAAGLPVVGSRIAGVPSITGADRRLLPTPGDVGQLIDSLTLLEDDAIVDGESRRVRERYEEMFTPAVNRPLLEGLYSEAVGC